MPGTGAPPLTLPLELLQLPILDPEQLRGEGAGLLLGPRPRVLEIGFGRGELLLASAARRPGEHFLGVEVSRKRVVKMAARVRRAELENIRLVCAPAETLLDGVLPEESFAACWVHCPDPWPKKRHHRRRFFQPETIAQLARVLEPGALLHMSTDHEAYAQWIDERMRSAPALENLCSPEPWSRERPEGREPTAYEAEWVAEGRRIAYFRYRKRAGRPLA